LRQVLQPPGAQAPGKYKELKEMQGTFSMESAGAKAQPSNEVYDFEDGLKF